MVMKYNIVTELLKLEDNFRSLMEEDDESYNKAKSEDKAQFYAGRSQANFDAAITIRNLINQYLADALKDTPDTL